MEPIRVVVRCRPLSPQEIQDQRTSAIKVNHIRSEVSIASPDSENSRTFSFNDVFNSEASQREIYSHTAFPIVDSVLKGYNGTILAYGQSGSGKTYTMQGDLSVGDSKGTIPQAIQQIFNRIESAPDKRFFVQVSFFEIYNEEVHDLLSRDTKNKLQVFEKPNSEPHIEGLLSLPVENAYQACQKLVTGNKNREMRLIRMGEKSSRSHSIFSITVESFDEDAPVRMGKLNLVDLAGSDNKIISTGMIAQETVNININKSLITLGNVIYALNNPKPLHVPYRDSKLTRILQDSLGGNANTVVIANIGPADCNYEETLHTLRFASRLKGIKNKPKINDDPHESLLVELQKEIGTLKARLDKEKEQAIERERRKIEELEDFPDADRERLLADLAAREKAWEADEELDQMMKELKELEKYVLRGSATVEYEYKEEEQMEETKKRNKFLLEKFERELERKDDLCIPRYREPYVDSQNKKIRKLSFLLQSANFKLQELQEDYSEERASYQQQISLLVSQLKRKDCVINHFIPQDNLAKIEAISTWNEQEEDWVLPDNVRVSQNRLMKSTSSLASTRPNSGYVKKSRDSSFDWKLKGGDILDVELERFNRRRLGHINGSKRTGAGQDEDELNKPINRLNVSDDDREEEKVMDKKQINQKTRRILYVPPQRASFDKNKRKESSDQEEKTFISYFSDDDDF